MMKLRKACTRDGQTVSREWMVGGGGGGAGGAGACWARLSLQPCQNQHVPTTSIPAGVADRKMDTTIATKQ